MTDSDKADRRIEQLERELAQVQTGATYRQIEANLVRQKLKATLAIAVAALGRMTIEFGANVDRMADDLNGVGKR